MSAPRIVAVCASDARGVRKRARASGRLREDWGLEGDAHAGPWHRQLSLLAEESIAYARDRFHLDVGAGDFAENLTTRGIDLVALPIGARLRIGRDAIVEITQKGKKCHTGCEIRASAGQCVFPTHGIFAKVLTSGEVSAGDPVIVDVPPADPRS